jgi:hypothetical protein
VARSELFFSQSRKGAAFLYYCYVIPPSTGGQAGIFAHVGAAVASNCKDAFGMKKFRYVFTLKRNLHNQEGIATRFLRNNGIYRIFLNILGENMDQRFLALPT